jgi:hypothetical protein
LAQIRTRDKYSVQSPVAERVPQVTGHDCWMVGLWLLKNSAAGKWPK